MGLCCSRVSEESEDEFIIDNNTSIRQSESPATVRPADVNPPVPAGTIAPRSASSTESSTGEQPPARPLPLPENNAANLSDTASKYETIKETAEKLPSKDLQHLTTSKQEKRRLQPWKRITKDEDLLLTFLQKLNAPLMRCIPSSKVYNLEEVEQNSRTYRFVLSKFNTDNKFTTTFGLTKVCRVWNPYLFSQYLVYKTRHKDSLKERHLFHGTNYKGAQAILKDNFDWRKVVNGKYGWGVSFADHPWYASHYSTRFQTTSHVYVMFLAKVLVEDGNLCTGCTDTKVPSEGYTTTNDNAHVLVKYDDGSFYPEFIIYFTRGSYDWGAQAMPGQNSRQFNRSYY